jgi:hypothetical protein
VRSVIIGVAIGAVCGATAGFGCAIAVGAVAGGLLGGANYLANAKNKSIGGFVKAVGGGAVSGATRHACR